MFYTSYRSCNKKENKLKLNNETLDVYEKINSFFNSFYEAFYKFNLLNMEEFGQKRNEIREMIKQHRQSKKMVKMFKGSKGDMGKMMKKFGGRLPMGG